jgi:hypothetical protein
MNTFNKPCLKLINVYSCMITSFLIEGFTTQFYYVNINYREALFLTTHTLCNYSVVTL